MKRYSRRGAGPQTRNRRGVDRVKRHGTSAPTALPCADKHPCGERAAHIMHTRPPLSARHPGARRTSHCAEASRAPPHAPQPLPVYTASSACRIASDVFRIRAAFVSDVRRSVLHRLPIYADTASHRLSICTAPASALPPLLCVRHIPAARCILHPYVLPSPVRRTLPSHTSHLTHTARDSLSHMSHPPRRAHFTKISHPRIREAKTAATPAARGRAKNP